MEIPSQDFFFQFFLKTEPDVEKFRSICAISYETLSIIATDMLQLQIVDIKLA